MRQARKRPRIEHIPKMPQDVPDHWEATPSRILVVDDEEGIRESINEFLRSVGFLSFTSAEPCQALEIIKNQFIHLVILDLHLSEADGTELQQRIAALSPDTAVIIITGYESLDSVRKTFKAGAYDYLTKPINLSTLENVVKNCLERQRLELENRRLLKQLKQTCEQLKEREGALVAKAAEADYYLNNILEKANDIIFTLDSDGRITYVNPKIEVLGYTRDTLIGASFFSLLFEKADAVTLNRSMAIERPQEWEISLRDSFGKERPMIISTSPVHDAYRGFTGVLGIALDLAAPGRLRARFKGLPVPEGNQGYPPVASLQSMSRHHRGILNGIPYGIALIGRDGSTHFANQPFLDIFCRAYDEVVNRPLSDYLPPSLLSPLEPIIERGMRGETSPPLEVAMKGDLHQGRALEIRLIPFYGEAGGEPDTLLIIEDVTRTRAIAQERTRRERMDAMLQLASGVAHEVRNPLSTISGSVQYLHSIMEQEDNPIQEHLGVISESCELIDSIINELMNFARPRSLAFGKSDINACVHRMVSLLLGRCQRRHIEVRLELDSRLPPIICDEEYIGQVFINLMVNAIQAMPHGGTLTICTRNEPLHQRALILFQDTGSGIKPDEIERVFEPFFSKKSKGIGLGLTVSRRIIEDHFGRIWIESDEGKGTRVYMQLPHRMKPKERE